MNQVLKYINLFVLLMDLLSTRRTSHDDGSINDNLGIWSARDTWLRLVFELNWWMINVGCSFKIGIVVIIWIITPTHLSSITDLSLYNNLPISKSNYSQNQQNYQKMNRENERERELKMMRWYRKRGKWLLSFKNKQTLNYIKLYKII